MFDVGPFIVRGSFNSANRERFRVDLNPTKLTLLGWPNISVEDKWSFLSKMGEYPYNSSLFRLGHDIEASPPPLFKKPAELFLDILTIWQQ